MFASKHLSLSCLPSPDFEIFTRKKKIQERKLIAVVLIPRKITGRKLNQGDLEL